MKKKQRKTTFLNFVNGIFHALNCTCTFVHGDQCDHENKIETETKKYQANKQITDITWKLMFIVYFMRYN